MKCPGCGAEASGKFCSSCGAAVAGASCPACSAPLSPGARFCHVCGAPLAAARLHGARPAAVPWIVAGVTVVALVVLLVARSSNPSSSIAQGGGRSGASPSIPGAEPRGVAAPDISQMSPRERADRLFNRVMTAAEDGNTRELSFFGPMALQAYAMLGALDPDARYHVGLIEANTGNLGGAAAQADSLERQSPGHLFAPLLRWEVAHRRNDTAGLRQAYRRFLDRYDREMASGKSEYQEHRSRLEAFRDEARGAVGARSS